MKRRYKSTLGNDIAAVWQQRIRERLAEVKALKGRALHLRFSDYSMPDPDHESVDDALHCARYSPDRLTPQQAMTLASLGEAYCHWVGHPASTILIVRQLREVRRTIRVRRREAHRMLPLVKGA